MAQGPYILEQRAPGTAAQRKPWPEQIKMFKKQEAVEENKKQGLAEQKKILHADLSLLSCLSPHQIDWDTLSVMCCKNVQSWGYESKGEGSEI